MSEMSYNQIDHIQVIFLHDIQNRPFFGHIYIVKWPFWVPPWGNWLNKSFGVFFVLTVNKT